MHINSILSLMQTFYHAYYINWFKQMHNKIISWNGNWILIFICFLGRLCLSTSSYSSFIIESFIIQMINMDKRFFKNWVLHIPHRLRDLVWMVRAWFSIAPVFFFSSYELRFFFFPESVESKYFLLAHIPWMNEFYDPGRPFKVAITTFSSTASSCSAF